MKLAIVGSKNVPGNLTGKVYDACYNALRELAPSVFISGGCRGVDKIAEKAADALSIDKIIFNPTKKRWDGPGGFKERNGQIAMACDYLIRIVVIVPGTKRTYGSGWTRDYALSLGKTTEEIIIDG